MISFNDIGYKRVSSFTYPKTYSPVNISSLKAEQVSNRDSASWKKAAVIFIQEAVTEYDFIPVIKGWRSLASNDQLLIMNRGAEYQCYDNFGNMISHGSTDQVLKYISGIPSFTDLQPSSYSGNISPIIYYGAPGTGKTYHCQTEILDKYSENNKFFVTFHQSFSYEEFIEGIKPTLIASDSNSDVKYNIEKGIFYKACERAAQIAGYTSLEECIADSKETRAFKFHEAIDNNKTVVLCIDEINRANVASVFGDIISLIEPSKRLGVGALELKAILPYSKKEFGVPANLFIIGTMNTADRSIQLLDSALRRRFRFKEFLPQYNIFNNGTAKEILRSINSRIRAILNKDSQIGHAYLMHAATDADIFSAIVNKIIPLLEEYFYNDISKVRFVLNETRKTKYCFYKRDDEAARAYEYFANDNEIDSGEKDFFSFDENLKNIAEEIVCKKYIQHIIGLDENIE